jgi:hypothetical protein
MKKLKIVLIILLANSQLYAQDLATNRETLKKLNYMAGYWKGEATIQQRGGPPKKAIQEERIEWRLDSLVLTIEGMGKDPVTQKVAFHAFAIINYNQLTKKLEMKSFTMEGRQTDAYFTIVSENEFVWGFDVPAGKIKYTINLSPQNKTWNERGEYSADGIQWYPTFQMSLTKTE